MSPSKLSGQQCLKVRQTMFQFLKRKKHTELQKSLKQFDNSSSKSIKNVSVESSKKKDCHSRAKSTSFYHDFIVEDQDTIPLISNKKNKFGNNSNITPRKITFAGDEVAQKQQSSRKPLLDLISPIKSQNRSNLKNVEPSEMKQRNRQKDVSNKKSILKSQSLRKNNSESYSKRKINTSIQNLEQTFQTIFHAGNSARQKNSELSIALINFVKDLQKNRNKQNFSVDRYFIGQSRNLGEIKHILHAINSSLQVFGSQSEANELIEEFNKNLSEHLHDIETCQNHNLKQEYQEELMNVKKVKQSQISQLQSENNKLERQIQKLNRLLEKTQQQHDNQIRTIVQRQQNLLETIESIKASSEEQRFLANEKITLLSKQLSESKQASKELQKRLKDYLYKDQRREAESNLKLQEQSAARQEFLLNQIESLKRSFNSDISELHALYQSKQVQYQKRIQALTAQLDKQKYERKIDKDVSGRILEQANLSRNDATKLTKKNQQLVQDLYRMNEDLFQHWLALRDVKTLSERLHIFQHFERIFTDLRFNPHLFRV